MELLIVSMFDKLDGCHKGLYQARTEARASADFTAFVKARAQSKDPLDVANVELHKLGVFDDESGVITPLPHYEVLPFGVPEDSGPAV